MPGKYLVHISQVGPIGETNDATQAAEWLVKNPEAQLFRLVGRTVPEQKLTLLEAVAEHLRAREQWVGAFESNLRGIDEANDRLDVSFSKLKVAYDRSVQELKTDV